MAKRKRSPVPTQPEMAPVQVVLHTKGPVTNSDFSQYLSVPSYNGVLSSAPVQRGVQCLEGGHYVYLLDVVPQNEEIKNWLEARLGSGYNADMTLAEDSPFVKLEDGKWRLIRDNEDEGGHDNDLSQRGFLSTAGSLTAEANGPQANQVPSPIVVIQPPTPGDVPSEAGKLMSVNNQALHGLDAPNAFTKSEEPKQRDDGSGGECPGELSGLKSGREKHTAPATTAKAITDESTRSTPSTIGTEARSSGDLPKEKLYPAHDNLVLELDEAEIRDIEEVEEMMGVEAEAVDPECLIAFDA